MSPAGLAGRVGRLHVMPDLRASPVVLSREAFLEVVLGGGRRQMGMPQFSDLSEVQASALQHYIRSQVPNDAEE